MGKCILLERPGYSARGATTKGGNQHAESTAQTVALSRLSQASASSMASVISPTYTSAPGTTRSGLSATAGSAGITALHVYSAAPHCCAHPPLRMTGRARLSVARASSATTAAAGKRLGQQWLPRACVHAAHSMFLWLSRATPGGMHLPHAPELAAALDAFGGPADRQPSA